MKMTISLNYIYIYSTEEIFQVVEITRVVAKVVYILHVEVSENDERRVYRDQAFG